MTRKMESEDDEKRGAMKEKSIILVGLMKKSDTEKGEMR